MSSGRMQAGASVTICWVRSTSGSMRARQRQKRVGLGESDPCWTVSLVWWGGTVDCPYGTIEVKYERRIVNDKEETRMWVTVPPSTTGYLLLPSDAFRVAVKRLGKGGYDVGRNGQRILLEPGKYELLL